MRALVLLALCLAQPLSAEVRKYTIDQLLSSTNWVGPPNPAVPADYASSFSPDGRKILVSSNKTGVYNAFAVPVDGSAPVQLTESTVSAIRTIGYFPKDERFLYESDQGGNELAHLYVRTPDGQVRDLTPGEKHRSEFLDWASDGSSIFFITNERDPGLFDVYETTLDGYERKLLFTNPGEFVPAGVSPDRRLVVLTKARSRVDVDIHLHDRTTGKTTLLALGSPAENGFATFSPDGKFLYYMTDHAAEFKRLMRYDLATGKSEEVLNPGWDVIFAGFSRSGRHLLVTINHDSRIEIRMLDAATLRPVE
ncbi:MAG TPA: DPP IV N-terminal domain-containing protein, partial [Thermoanaerobaculia bacterium]|nr:DPP IV N-terminal domain-containing protein [Thermoanaerobaculia bacterium]